MVYTVDEVSDALGIPRPTLYRYLREYAIPHVRRSGKISIPEESLERIREARELHREGLGTDSVRRRLREGNDPEELTERLDRISEALEDLRGGVTAPANGPSPQALHTILERQDALILAVSTLTGMVRDLSDKDHSEGGGYHPRGTTPKYPGDQTRERESAPEPPVALSQEERSDVVEVADTVATPQVARFVVAPGGGGGFGASARRRRRTALMLLPVLLVGAVLGVGALASGGEEVDEVPAVEEEVASEEVAPEEVASEEAAQEDPSVGEEEPLLVRVPELVGLPLPEAESALASASLGLGDWEEASSYWAPVGVVISQGGPAGAEVDLGSRVDLVVSAGPPPFDDGGLPGGVGQYPPFDAPPEQPF